jgi:ADP-heptose:LPS heptosyltransferase
MGSRGRWNESLLHRVTALIVARSGALHRAIDASVGIPLVGAVSLFRTKRALPQRPARVGFISPTAIGDLILSSGVLLHLREHVPDAAIHLFHGANNAVAVPLLPVDLTAYTCNFTSPRATLSTLREAKLDVLVDLTPWTRLTAFYAAMSEAATVGYEARRKYRHFAFDRVVTHDCTRHETENLRAIAEVFAPCPGYVVRVREDLPAVPLHLPFDRLVLMHASPGGSRAREKSWPEASWAQLAQRLAADGYVIAFSGTRADAERAGRILSLAGLPEQAAFSLCGRLSFAELASVLAASRLLVTIDTGVLHLASALGVRMVALHGPTRSSRWGALSPLAISLDSPHPAAGYIHFGFESSPQAMQVMPMLTVERVYEACQRAIQLPPRSAAS